MEDLTAAMGLCGGTRDTDDSISDDELFKQPPPKEDCPICLLPLPLLLPVHKSCCGKIICSGCRHTTRLYEGIEIIPSGRGAWLSEAYCNVGYAYDFGHGVWK